MFLNFVDELDNKLFREFIFVKVLFIFIFFASCSEYIPEGELTGVIQMKGSDTMVNASQKLAENFMESHPYVFIAVTGGGSGVGIASLINKTCDIACASRRIKLKEIKLAEKQDVYPQEFVVAFDGVAVVVNPANPIDKLTLKQIHDIFTGRIKNWKELGWKDKKIVVLSREVSSGTHMYFKKHVVRMGDKNSREEFDSGALLLSSSQAIVEEVSSNDACIGYFGMGYIVPGKTKALAIAMQEGRESFLPTEKNVVAGNYPLSRPLYMYTNGEPQGVVREFINFVLSSKGQEIFKETGFIPLNSDAHK